MVTWHLIAGEEGCAWAWRRHCVAVVVDALRASSTAAMLLDAGATEILAVREVEEAFAAKKAYPDALLFGERNGLPPTGFDYGNSPRCAAAARGKRVVFTTTTGAKRLIDAWGAHMVLMGGTINASVVGDAAREAGRDIVVIPAGLDTDPDFDAQEDWVAATGIVMRQPDTAIGEGKALYEAYRQRILDEGIPELFRKSPHAAKLCAIGLEDDVTYCAQEDTTRSVPVAVERNRFGVILRGTAAKA